MGRRLVCIGASLLTVGFGSCSQEREASISDQPTRLIEEDAQTVDENDRALATLKSLSFENPSLAKSGSESADFAPLGWLVEAEAEGDLNADGVSDLALVLQKSDPNNIITNSDPDAEGINANPRILAVAFQSEDGEYQLAVQNHLLIPRWTDPAFDDPLSEIAVSSGVLRLSLSHSASVGSWSAGSKTFTLRWQDGEFKLIGYDALFADRGSGQTDEVSINFLTHRKSVATGSLSRDHERVSWERIRARPLLTLDQIGNGSDFNPDEAI